MYSCILCRKVGEEKKPFIIAVDAGIKKSFLQSLAKFGSLNSFMFQYKIVSSNKLLAKKSLLFLLQKYFSNSCFPVAFNFRFKKFFTWVSWFLSSFNPWYFGCMKLAANLHLNLLWQRAPQSNGRIHVYQAWDPLIILLHQRYFFEDFGTYQSTRIQDWVQNVAFNFCWKLSSWMNSTASIGTLTSLFLTIWRNTSVFKFSKTIRQVLVAKQKRVSRKLLICLP